MKIGTVLLGITERAAVESAPPLNANPGLPRIGGFMASIELPTLPSRAYLVVTDLHVSRKTHSLRRAILSC